MSDGAFCHYCCRLGKLSPIKRQWLGDPPPTWPRYKLACEKCIADPNPKRLIEPITDFGTLGTGSIAAYLAGFFALVIVAAILLKLFTLLK